MAWQQELTLITRTLINDLKDPYEFSDARIQQVIVVAAKYVQFDVNLDHIYAIDVVNNSITPDPTTNNDDIFNSLVCLKTACIIDQGKFRTKAAMEGIRAALGPASLSVGGSLSGWKEIIAHGACALYEELTSHWDVKNATAIRAILSPFVGNKFDPRNLSQTSYDHGYDRQNNSGNTYY
jgi:hypothetical protein